MRSLKIAGFLLIILVVIMLAVMYLVLKGAVA